MTWHDPKHTVNCWHTLCGIGDMGQHFLISPDMMSTPHHTSLHGRPRTIGAWHTGANLMCGLGGVDLLHTLFVSLTLHDIMGHDDTAWHDMTLHDTSTSMPFQTGSVYTEFLSSWEVFGRLREVICHFRGLESLWGEKKNDNSKWGHRPFMNSD